jgi:hypothetical protein
VYSSFIFVSKLTSALAIDTSVSAAPNLIVLSLDLKLDFST